MKLQVSTLFKMNAKGRIAAINEPGGSGGPLLFIGKTSRNTQVYYHEKLTEPAVREVKRNLPGSLEVSELCRVIEKYHAVKKVWIGPAYAYIGSALPPILDEQIVVLNEENSHLLQPYFKELEDHVTERAPVVACVKDGHAVSVCCSARMSDRAAEAGLETLASVRGMGLGSQVTAKWIEEVVRSGLVPLYSTSWDNISSQRIAHKLGLHQYGWDFHLSAE